jgi:hypothetical protein
MENADAIISLLQQAKALAPALTTNYNKLIEARIAGIINQIQTLPTEAAPQAPVKTPCKTCSRAKRVD